MSKKNTSSRREFLGKALAAIGITSLNPIVFLDPRKLFASNGGNQTLDALIVDLTLTKYASLLNVNGSVVIIIPYVRYLYDRIILTRTDTNTFVAVNGYCTHKQFILNPYNNSTHTIDCTNNAPGHGSQFDVNGVVVTGPAEFNLEVYTTTYTPGDTKVYVEIPLLTVKDGMLVSIPTLYQNFPNPVKSITTIRFKIDYYSKVTLTVADNLGHIIAILADGEFFAGEYSFDFDASIFPSGTYFYRLNANGEVVTKQMTVVK
jgi:nitrite reductase/ring-hydroxylating ferredoxin subunit